MSNLNFEWRPVKDLKPSPNNARTHSSAQIQQLCQIITELGFINPIVLDEKGLVLAGHARLEAAKQLKLDKAPTVEVKNLSATQKKAYMLADNRIPQSADWDEDLLRVELTDLIDDKFQMDLLGFDQKELDKLLNVDELLEGESQELSEQFAVLVTCNNEAEQQKLFEEFSDRGLSCKVMSI